MESGDWREVKIRGCGECIEGEKGVGMLREGVSRVESGEKR